LSILCDEDEAYGRFEGGVPRLVWPKFEGDGLNFLERARTNIDLEVRLLRSMLSLSPPLS